MTQPKQFAIVLVDTIEQTDSVSHSFIFKSEIPVEEVTDVFNIYGYVAPLRDSRDYRLTFAESNVGIRMDRWTSKDEIFRTLSQLPHGIILMEHSLYEEIKKYLVLYPDMQVTTYRYEGTLKTS